MNSISLLSYWLNYMKDLTETIRESAEITGLRPSFYFNNLQFFETLTDPEEQKFITASYKRVDNNHYIYFYYKRKQIGFLKLKPITVYSWLREVQTVVGVQQFFLPQSQVSSCNIHGTVVEQFGKFD